MLPPQPFHCAVLHPQPVYHSVMPRHAPPARQRLERQSGGGRSAGRLCREVWDVLQGHSQSARGPALPHASCCAKFGVPGGLRDPHTALFLHAGEDCRAPSAQASLRARVVQATLWAHVVVGCVGQRAWAPVYHQVCAGHKHSSIRAGVEHRPFACNLRGRACMRRPFGSILLGLFGSYMQAHCLSEDAVVGLLRQPPLL